MATKASQKGKGSKSKTGGRKVRKLAKQEPVKTRDIGIDVASPQKSCTDKHCPFHGKLPVRGHAIEGVVVSDKMTGTVVVKREYMRYIPKYERYEKRTSRYFAHCPDCVDAEAGSRVKIIECRPLSKKTGFVVIEARA